MSAPTTVLAYPAGAVVRDYLRAGAGMALAGIPLLAVPTIPVFTWLLAAAVVVFAVYGVRTVGRHLTRIEVSERAIGPIAWQELTEVRLTYYPSRRDRTDGWMQMTLSGGGRRLSVDSRLAGFDALAARASAMAAANGRPLDAATVDNLAALGIAANGGAGTPAPARHRNVVGGEGISLVVETDDRGRA